MRKVWAVLALAVGTTAGAQQDVGQQQAGQQPAGAARASSAATGPTSDAFNRACVDLLNGRMPEGEKAIKSLRDACANLMSGRADERIDAERKRQQQIAAQEQLKAVAEGRPPSGQVQVQPGQATAQPQQGTGVLAAFTEAGAQLTGVSSAKMGYGMRQSGNPVRYLLVTNPFGWFTGLGVNAELFGAFEAAPKFSWVAGARYAATDASNGTARTFGGEAGVDWFIMGRNNEGLRVGPRVEVAAGREDFEGGTTFARMGLGGEVGYNFIATNGITGMAAVGIGGRVAGDSQNDDFASFVGGEFGPYGKIGIGYSW